jgi:hypothetical protein
MLPFPEAFLAFITTMPDGPPVGVMKAELTKARAIRDGKHVGKMLPLLYEFPTAMQQDREQWINPENWAMVNPNVGKSVTVERLIELYGYQPEFEFVERTENWGDDGRAPFLYYIVRCRLIHRESGIQVASGIGSCNTRESKYAYRWVWARDIPEGVSPKTLRQRTTRKGQGDPQYALPNTEIGDLANTVLKMAQKRAMIAAVLVACRVGGMFQQDLEDAPDAELLGEEEATRPWERAEAAASASVVERLITAMRSAVVGKDPKEALAALKLEAGSHARERLSKDERDQVAAAYREITAELKAAMPKDKGSDPGTAAPAPAAETVNPTTGEVST